MKTPQPISTERRFTINDFNDQFTDNDACLDWLMEQRYPGAIATRSYCKVERKHHHIERKMRMPATTAEPISHRWLGRSLRSPAPRCAFRRSCNQPMFTSLLSQVVAKAE
jgi:hypothetical protein